MKTAGELAMRNYGNHGDSYFKSDDVIDLVTETDIEISTMFEKFAAENFSDMDYCIIDEESLDALGEDRFAEINKHEWQFVIDPVDGTLTYALGIPMFAISVGVLHHGKPFCGAAYAPALCELIYGSEREAFWVRNAFTDRAQKTELKLQDSDRRALIFNMHSVVRFNDSIDVAKDSPRDFYSSVVHLMYMATGRGKALYFVVKIWDIAGLWAIMKLLGLKYMDYRTGEVLQVLSPDKFDNDMVIKNVHICCRPQDFDHYKNIAEEIRR